jgi:predicted metal-binding membrane protein
VFLGISAIVFAASAAMTIVWCQSMSAMAEMEMPGGWTMSHMWMLSPKQSWLGATTSFVGMWVVTMGAMMLPSLTPTLWCYRESAGRMGGTRLGWLTTLVGAGYFAVWAVSGAVVFSLGVVLADIAMREAALARAVPMVVGAAVLAAGVIQHSGWKARLLALCREAPGHHRTTPVGTGAAWRHGLQLGLCCSQSCAGLTAVALALGMMDLRVMAVVGAAITVERLAPNGVRAARVIGAVVAAVGFALIAQATGLAWPGYRLGARWAADAARRPVDGDYTVRLINEYRIDYEITMR